MNLSLVTSLLIGICFLEVNGRLYGRRKPRPGVCPDPLTCYPITKYHRSCRDDYDCDVDDKCCPDVGGHHICQKVRNIQRYSGCPSPKSVSCIIERGVPDARHRDCDRHSDCAPNFSCCSDEFGHRICVQSPKKAKSNMKEKPGVCRKPRPGAVTCDRECSHDIDCRGRRKCCFNGCTHVCMMPRHQYQG